MKNNLSFKSLDGKIQLTISPEDSVAWKLSMLFEAAHSTTDSIQDIAQQYGYT